VKYIATVDGRDFEIDIDRQYEAIVDGTQHAVDLRVIDGAHLYSLVLDHESIELFVERREGQYFVLIEGDRYLVDVDQERLKKLKAFGGQVQDATGTAIVEAPMPGLVIRVLVAPGDTVAEDQGLVILEAMKMENEIRSPKSGIVQSVPVEDGKTVDKGDSLVIIVDEEDSGEDS
jgi:pyruvate carboxylase subunit B